MIRSVATSAQTIVVLSIGNMKRRAAFGHMTWSCPSVRDFVGNGWVLAHTSRLISFVGFEIVQRCMQAALSACSVFVCVSSFAQPHSCMHLHV